MLQSCLCVLEIWGESAALKTVLTGETCHHVSLYFYCSRTIILSHFGIVVLPSVALPYWTLFSLTTPPKFLREVNRTSERIMDSPRGTYRCSQAGHRSPCLFELLVAGTVPAFTAFCCIFQHLVAQRRKGDLCVTASSKNPLAFEKTPVAQSSTCSTPAFSRQLPWTWIRLRPSWSETQRVARKRSLIHKKATWVCLLFH